jgi:hypothetical protein
MHSLVSSRRHTGNQHQRRQLLPPHDYRISRLRRRPSRGNLQFPAEAGLKFPTVCNSPSMKVLSMPPQSLSVPRVSPGLVQFHPGTMLHQKQRRFFITKVDGIAAKRIVEKARGGAGAGATG